MIKLLHITGPQGPANLTALSTKARRLAEQVDTVNHEAVDALLWQHMPIVNIVSVPMPSEHEDAPTPDSQEKGEKSAHDSDARVKSLAYFLGKNSGTIQQPVELALFTGATHLELAQCREETPEMKTLSDDIGDYIPDDADSYFINYKTANMFTWRYWLSECPPVRTPLAQNITEELSDDPFWCWFKEQEEYQFWYKQEDVETRILLVHGSSLVDIWSDKIHHGVNASESEWSSTIHFKFERNDARFNNVHGMMSYLVTQLSRQLSFMSQAYVVEDMESFLGNARACSTADLFQWFIVLRQHTSAESVRFIVSRIDHCQDDVIEYLHRIQDMSKHTELRFRLLLTYDANSERMRRLEGHPSIDLDLFTVHETYSPDGLRGRNRRLFEELPILDNETKALVDQTVASCGSDFQLSGMVLAWLTSVQKQHCPGLEAIETLRNFAKPLSPVSACAAIRASLTGSLQVIEKEVFIIVKTALHPLSIDQIAWVLISSDTGDHLGDPRKRQWDATVKIRQLLPGLYELKHGEVHLCHDYWKSEKSHSIPDETSRHAMMASCCLGYLSLPQVQEGINDLADFADEEWVYPAYFGNNLTAYSVKFLSHHCRVAGDKEPKQALFDFFKNENTRMSWYNVHTLLTSYLLRSGTYSEPLRALPVVAQTGLADLTAMVLESERRETTFKTDIHLALVEAARYGQKDVINLLLKEADAKDGALPVAISSAARYGSAEPLYALISRCAKIKDFEWPEDILHRVSWLGLTTMAEVLLKAGVVADPVKEPESYPGQTPLTLCMTGRHQQTAKLLIQEGKADVNLKSSSGRFPLIQAARYCNLDVVTLQLQRNAGDNKAVLHDALANACFSGAFTSVQELLTKLSAEDWESRPEQSMEPLTTAILGGYVKCVKALTTHGINTNQPSGEMVPLLTAVMNKRLEIARLLLSHGADPNFATERFRSPLLAAASNENIPMVKLLVEKGADLELEDQTGAELKTVLCSAAAGNNKDLLDVLLDMGADVNHVAAGSSSPLVNAAWNSEVDNVRTLLKHGANVNTAVPNPPDWAPINGAYDSVPTLKALIEAGADINHNSSDGTVLYLASRWGFEATVEALLEYRRDLDLDKAINDEILEEDDGMSPLCVACKYNRVGIVRLLLEAGANAQQESPHGNFPLALCVQHPPQELPEQTLRALLEYPSRVDLKQQDNAGDTALHKIRRGTPLAVVKLLVNAGAELDMTNHEGYTPLAVAIDAGNVEVSRYLLSKIDSPGSGLLHRAIFGGNQALIQMMVEGGADVNEVDPRTGETPLYAYLTGSNPSLSIVRYLVDVAKTDVNLASTNLRYPIMQACKFFNREIVHFLVEAGADVNVKDASGRSPIHVLYYSQHHDYDDIDFLVEHGADLRARDKLGRTAVHYAAALADEDDIETLLDLSGIDINQADDDGWTPLLWACQQRKTFNFDYVAEILINRGADIWVQGKVEDEQWSPLKLARFQGGYGDWVLERLEPQDKSKPRNSQSEDDQEYWNDEVHKSRQGTAWEGWTCDGCFCVSLFVLCCTIRSASIAS